MLKIDLQGADSFHRVKTMAAFLGKKNKKITLNESKYLYEMFDIVAPFALYIQLGLTSGR